MKNIDLPLNASCQCGRSHFEVTAQPLARFVCHCEVCQNFTKGPYSDVTVVWSKDVILSDISSTNFKRYKAPPNIRRGICAECNKPSIEFGIFDQLAFIPTKNYEQPKALSSPALHAFYHRRVDDVSDDLPKHEGFVKSQLAIMGLLARSVKSRLINRHGG